MFLSKLKKKFGSKTSAYVEEEERDWSNDFCDSVDKNDVPTKKGSDKSSCDSVRDTQERDYDLWQNPNSDDWDTSSCSELDNMEERRLSLHNRSSPLESTPEERSTPTETNKNDGQEDTPKKQLSMSADVRRNGRRDEQSRAVRTMKSLESVGSNSKTMKRQAGLLQQLRSERVTQPIQNFEKIRRLKQESQLQEMKQLGLLSRDTKVCIEYPKEFDQVCTVEQDNPKNIVDVIVIDSGHVPVRARHPRHRKSHLEFGAVNRLIRQIDTELAKSDEDILDEMKSHHGAKNIRNLTMPRLHGLNTETQLPLAEESNDFLVFFDNPSKNIVKEESFEEIHAKLMKDIDRLGKELNISI